MCKGIPSNRIVESSNFVQVNTAKEKHITTFERLASSQERSENRK